MKYFRRVGPCSLGLNLPCVVECSLFWENDKIEITLWSLVTFSAMSSLMHAHCIENSGASDVKWVEIFSGGTFSFSSSFHNAIKIMLLLIGFHSNIIAILWQAPANRTTNETPFQVVHFYLSTFFHDTILGRFFLSTGSIKINKMQCNVFFLIHIWVSDL